MKLKMSLVVVLAALVVFGLSGAAFAFHAGGVAQCEGCHTMHNSKGGVVMSRTTGSDFVPNSLAVGQAGPFLLQGSDQSSTCLNCHGSHDSAPNGYHVLSTGVTQPVERTPGGDFDWLRYKSIKGHSIVAADYGFAPETTKAGNVAPGGIYPVANLACSSCHDPHGKYRKLDNTGSFATTGLPIGSSGSYGADPTPGVEAVGSYRLLAGKLYLPKSISTNPALAFDEDPMNAAAPSSYNRTEASTETLVTYGKGVGIWCQQCHPKMHMTAGTAVNVHPNDQAIGSTVQANYNSYISSGNMVPGGGGYTSLIPVAYDNQTQNSLLMGHFTTGFQVASSDQVMCLSCHRAHASAFDYMLRFPIAEEMVVADATGAPIYNSGGRDLPGLTASDVQAGLYDRPASLWGVGQRTLCNKCHAKD